MKHTENYERVVAIKEMSKGNETVGDVWLETKTCNVDTPIHEIIEWAKNASGKLILTIDENVL